MGLWVDGMDFSGNKHGMLIAGLQQVQRQLFKFPFIQGIRSQLVRYSITEDTISSKLPQDITAVILMTAFHLRRYLWEDVEEKAAPGETQELSSAKMNRSDMVLTRETHL